MSKLVLLTMVVLASIVGCSVQRKEVQSRPPQITDPVLTLAFEEGTMRPEAMSAVMNDPSWSEQDAEAQMRVIGKASLAYEQGSLMAGGMQLAAKELYGAFAARKCIETFGPLGRDASHYTEFEKVDWRSGIDASSPAFADCEKNQLTRLAIKVKRDATAKSAADAYGALVNAAGINNIKQLGDKAKSLIKIETTRSGVTQVALAIGDFAGSGKVQTIGDGITHASWEKARRTLRFHITARSLNGELAEYRFSLHRAQDLLRAPAGSCAVLAKFTGEVTLVRLLDEKVIQRGSGQVTGWMMPNTGCEPAA